MSTAAAPTRQPRPPSRRRRGRHRWLRIAVTVVALGAAVYVLLPRVGQLSATADALHRADAPLLAVAVVLVLLTFPLSAVSLLGAAVRRLPFVRTSLVELAAAFLNRLTPAGVGRAGVLTRYLTVHGCSPLQTAGVLGLNLGAGAGVHAAGLVAAALLTGRTAVPRVQLPDRWADLLSVVAVCVGVGLVITAVVVRRRWGELAARLLPLRHQLTAALTHPGAVAALVGGVVGVNAAMIAALALCVAAFGGHPAIAIVALVYLGGTAIGSVAPTPGGLGAVDAALVAGLTGLGVGTGPAVAGVLAFRLLSWWLPAFAGAAAWLWLRRREQL